MRRWCSFVDENNNKVPRVKGNINRHVICRFRYRVFKFLEHIDMLVLVEFLVKIPTDKLHLTLVDELIVVLIETCKERSIHLDFIPNYISSIQFSTTLSVKI